MNALPAKRCTKCDEAKPLTEFGLDRRRGLRSACKECHREVTRRWREAHPEVGKKADREAKRRWRKSNPEAEREAKRRWREAHPEAEPEASRRRRATDREAVLDHYGRSCACCDSTERLTIDHVNGDGKEHRAEIGRSSSTLHHWLAANGFPAGFQTLCRRCNTSKKNGDHCRINHEERAA